MLDKLEAIESNFIDVERKLSDPEVISDQKKYQQLLRKHSQLKDGVDIFRRYKDVLSQVSDAKELLQDSEMADMAKEELAALEPEKESLENELQIFLIPADPDDHRNAVVEVRSGTGGDEAALFAADLYKMYTRFADSQNWKVEILSENITELGGVKEITFLVEGTGAYSKLKFESGTHRVQRVPETEASGRVHTSAATVAILPEADDEVDIEVENKDIRIDTYRASGAGGQHVNKTDSAVRITHLATGVVVACQDERSQFQNKDKAMRLLKTKLYEKQVEDRQKAESQNRKLQVGSGDRSQKIRTYNFPQSRVTDHRINLTLYTLDDILQGDIIPVIDALIAEDRLEKMKNQ